MSPRLRRLFAQRVIGNHFTITPWRRVRCRRGTPQESPRDLAYECRWSDGSQAGRVWWNGEGIEIRHRFYAPISAQFPGWESHDGDNGNGVTHERRPMARGLTLYWSRDEAVRECARQRRVVDVALHAIMALPAWWP